MLFSSVSFLFGFLPLCLLLYFLVPKRLKNAVIFFLSLIFYAWGEPVYAFLMLGALSSAYAFGFLIRKYRERNRRVARLFLWTSVLINLSLLVFFKYTNFFIENLRSISPLFSTLTPISGLALPVGISFYTFQIISYSIDLYLGKTELQRNYINFGTYVSLFPQLIAGPIVKYSDVDRQLADRTVTVEKFAHGIKRFVTGLSKKLILGDGAGALHAYFSSSFQFAPTSLASWMMMITYTLHIYFDFSGYSDMAIGLGQMLGFDFPENFNYPYIATSITDFWRRWHITHSTFFREYVYIPLGGNRCAPARQYMNLAVVWLLTGLWHGAAWTFVLWGAWYLALLIIEKAFFKQKSAHFQSIPARFFGHAYTLFCVGIGWLIFSSDSVRLALSSIGGLFGIGTGALSYPELSYTTIRSLPFLIFCAICSTPALKNLIRKASRKLFSRPSRAFRVPTAVYALEAVGFALLFVIDISYAASGSYSPFLYFNF